MQQAFQGYLAIPEKCGGGAWWEVLKIKPNAARAEIESAYKTLVKTAHPDKGGSHDGWIKIQDAFDQAMGQFR